MNNNSNLSYPPTPSFPSSPQPFHPTRGLLKMLLVIVVIALLGVMGSTIYLAYQANQQTEEVPIPKAPIKEISPSPIINKAVNENVPPIPGASLLISVVDEQGQTVQEGSVEVFVEYQDFPDRNYQYSVDLISDQGSLLPLYPPPQSHTSHRVATGDNARWKDKRYSDIKK